MHRSRRPSASVVVVTYNHRAVISRCLDALGATVSAQDEMIVVDNGSRDGTADLVAWRYPFVRLIRGASNLGFGAGCNWGARLARCEYLAFLNPDTEPRVGWLDALLEGLEATPHAAMTTGKLLLTWSADRVDAIGNDVHVSGITTSRGWGERSELHDHVAEVSAVSGACFAVRHALFHHLGGFDERLFLYFEDTDLSLRARLAGYSCLAVPKAVVLHDHRPGFSPAKLRRLERNRWWTLFKLLEWRTLVALAPVLAFAELLVWVMALYNGPRYVVAKALAWIELCAWLPELSNARAKAHRTRVISDFQLLTPHSARLSFVQVVDNPAARSAERLAEGLFSACRGIAMALVPH